MRNNGRIVHRDSHLAGLGGQLGLVELELATRVGRQRQIAASASTARGCSRGSAAGCRSGGRAGGFVLVLATASHYGEHRYKRE